MISHIRNSHAQTVNWTTTSAAVAVIVGQLCATWLNLCGTSPDSLAALATGFAVGVIPVTLDRCSHFAALIDRRQTHVLPSCSR